MSGSPLGRPAIALARTFAASALVVVLAGGAQAGELQGARTLPESRQHLLSDTTARAFDYVRAARRKIADKQSFEARKDLAQASALLAQARAASPGTQVREEISRLWVDLQDPTTQVASAGFDALFAAIDGAGAGPAYAATRRYVERARYFRKDGDAASQELVAASARIPHGELDGPLAAAYAGVHVAMIELFAGERDAADAELAQAERSALRAVRLASGAQDASVADVAAPAERIEPPAGDADGAFAAEPEATESEIPAPAEFQEPGRDD